MKKKILLSILALILLFLSAPWIFQAKADFFDPLPTEFIYSEECLSQIRSPCLITLERVDKWEKSLKNYFDKQNVPYLIQTHFYTYLYLAQRDAAFLSYNVHQCFIGSLDPLTRQIVLTFFPDFTDFPNLSTDAYSEELAKQVWPPYLKRLEKEIAQKIQNIAQWIPWTPHLPKAPPPSQDLKGQIETLKAQRDNLSEKQLDLVYAWAGEKGMEMQWRNIANNYMREESIPIGKTLFARSILMMSLYDSLITVFDAKYTYCIPRPSVLDETIRPFVHTPHAPSYPSAHAAQAGAADVILSFLFPHVSDMWHQIANDSAQSRIWASVHMPQDVSEGKKLGKKVGGMVLNTFYPVKEGSGHPAGEI